MFVNLFIAVHERDALDSLHSFGTLKKFRQSTHSLEPFPEFILEALLELLDLADKMEASTGIFALPALVPSPERVALINDLLERCGNRKNKRREFFNGKDFRDYVR